MEESVRVVCPHCGAINLVSRSPLAGAAKCARCHHLLPAVREPENRPDDFKPDKA